MAQLGMIKMFPLLLRELCAKVLESERDVEKEREGEKLGKPEKMMRRKRERLHQSKDRASGGCPSRGQWHTDSLWRRAIGVKLAR